MITKHQDIPDAIKSAADGATILCATGILAELARIAAGTDRMHRPDLGIREATKAEKIARGIDPETGKDAFEGLT